MHYHALLLLAASAVVTAGWIQDFENLVAFGDSYTDEDRLGYFIAHNGSAPPPGTLIPAANNTAGGGITWARWISTYSGAMLYNYGVSGAVCSNEIVSRYLSSVYGPFPDVVYETGAFVADANYINASTNTNTLYTNRTSNNTVYSMWIGTNDLGVNGFMTDSSLNETTIVDYADCIYNRFDEIYTAGGRYFVLMNTAPLQLTPLYGMPGVGGLAVSHYWPDKPANTSDISGKMKEYTKLANDVFSYRTPFELLIAKRYPGASMAIFDVNSLITDIYNNPTAFGLESPANVTGQYTLCDAMTGDCTSQTSVGASHFLWYDELHPSQQTDEAIAREFITLVSGTSKYATYW